MLLRILLIVTFVATADGAVLYALAPTMQIDRKFQVGGQGAADVSSDESLESMDRRLVSIIAKPGDTWVLVRKLPPVSVLDVGLKQDYLFNDGHVLAVYAYGDPEAGRLVDAVRVYKYVPSLAGRWVATGFGPFGDPLPTK